MEPPPAFEALAAALKEQLRLRGISARQVSHELGQHPAFLSRALSGLRPLRVEIVFELLAKLTVSPFEFFRVVYPFGGNPLPATGAPELEVPGVKSMEELAREVFRRRGVLSPTEYRLRLGEWLRAEIPQHDLSIREVSRRLGLGPTALGQALRGSSQLTFFHVLGTLRALGAHPGRPFLALFLPDLEDPIARMEREEVLRALEKVAAVGARELLKKRAAKARPATPQGGPSGDPPTPTTPE